MVVWPLELFWSLTLAVHFYPNRTPNDSEWVFQSIEMVAWPLDLFRSLTLAAHFQNRTKDPLTVVRGSVGLG